MRILAIDDEWVQMSYFWKALKRAGFEVYTCTTPSEAWPQYFAPGFHVIIIDRMMPRGEIMGGDETTPNIDTGYETVDYVRQYDHLKDVPIIVFTNHLPASEDKEKMEAADPHLLFVSKETAPSGFVEVLKKWIEKCNYQPPYATRPPDEHLNAVPYYATDVNNNTRIRLYFAACTKEEQALPDPHLSRWRYGSVFRERLRGDDTCRYMLKLLRHANPEQSVYGLYYANSPGMEQQWHRNVLFELSPDHEEDSSTRELSGLALVLVARFLRECLYRSGTLSEYVAFQSVRIEDMEDKLEPYTGMIRYLTNIGFRPAPGQSGLFRISNRDAKIILDSVHLQ
jgi:CheY-like chemotaxis protein